MTTPAGRVLPDGPVMLSFVCGGVRSRTSGGAAGFPSCVRVSAVVITKLTVLDPAVAVTVEAKNDTLVGTPVPRNVAAAWPFESVVVAGRTSVPAPLVIFQLTATPGMGWPEAFWATTSNGLLDSNCS